MCAMAACCTIACCPGSVLLVLLIAACLRSRLLTSVAAFQKRDLKHWL